MAKHKLEAGKQLIGAIVQLGMVLGYHVKKEFPIDEPSFGEAPAVDVAWFSQKGNRFPLFIFEVESKTTNGMPNNPLKVYAQENKKFEKPLFFFHVVAQGGVHSARPKYLETQYGQHNYRIYFIGSNTANDLVKDILAQHARVKEEVSYWALYNVLNSKDWAGIVNCRQSLMSAVNLGLSKEDIFSSYIKISLVNSDFISDLIGLFLESSRNGFEDLILDSYLGNHWGVPIITSYLCGLCEDTKESMYWSSFLLKWQRDSSCMPMISPALGLDRDYDDFILGCAPQLITLCVAISYKNKEISYELVLILSENLKKIGFCWEGLSSALYLLHLAAALGLNEIFHEAKLYILGFEGLAQGNIFFPPSCFSVIDQDAHEFFSRGDVFEISELKEFADQCRKIYLNKKVCREKMTLRALSDDTYVLTWSSDLLAALWL